MNHFGSSPLQTFLKDSAGDNATRRLPLWHQPRHHWQPAVHDGARKPLRGQVSKSHIVTKGTDPTRYFEGAFSNSEEGIKDRSRFQVRRPGSHHRSIQEVCHQQQLPRHSGYSPEEGGGWPRTANRLHLRFSKGNLSPFSLTIGWAAKWVLCPSNGDRFHFQLASDWTNEKYQNVWIKMG